MVQDWASLLNTKVKSGYAYIRLKFFVMKKTLLALALIIGGVTFQTTQAQIRLSINIGRQPVWGPVGYDYVDYYYMPDLDVYYSVPRGVYYYEDRGRWISATSLPSRYRSYDLYNTYKVVINDDPRPYMNAVNYRTKYGQYRGRHDQVVIRNSDDRRYWENKNHPNHNKWSDDRDKGNGNNGNNGKGRGKGKHN